MRGLGRKPSVVWRPPLLYRAGVLVSVVGLSIAMVAIATLGLRPASLLPAVAVLLLLWFVGWRILIGQLEADRSGIRNPNPLTSVRFAWGDVRALEARGGSFFTERIVVVTEDGERILWMSDTRVHMSRDAARIVVAELEAVRRSATTPHANGVDQRLAKDRDDLSLPAPHPSSQGSRRALSASGSD